MPDLLSQVPQVNPFESIEITEEEEYKAYQVVIQAKKHAYKNSRIHELLKMGHSVLEVETIIEEEIEAQGFDVGQEEAENCVLSLKEAKFYEAKAKAYNEKIKGPKVYNLPTNEEYFNQVEKRWFDLLEIDFTEENKSRVINKDNINQYNLLKQYFTKDPQFNNSNIGRSLNKGLWLIGPIGCGKTTLMKAFDRNPYQSYATVSCISIADKYAQKGMEGVYKYFDTVKNNFPHLYYGSAQLGWMFDDIGVEENKKHFGDELNVMADILQRWYDKIGIGFNKIHATTNLTVEATEKRYGSRVRSRLRQMFNIIEFDSSIQDKRK